MTARRKRRISSSDFPENMPPAMISIHPPLYPSNMDLRDVLSFKDIIVVTRESGPAGIFVRNKCAGTAFLAASNRNDRHRATQRVQRIGAAARKLLSPRVTAAHRNAALGHSKILAVP